MEKQGEPSEVPSPIRIVDKDVILGGTKRRLHDDTHLPETLGKGLSAW